VIRSDGQFVRDYFYVEDGAAAYMRLAEGLAGCSDLRGQAFNFSNEAQITVLELVAHLTRLMGATVDPIVLNQASNEIRHQYLDASKAKRMLDWEPLFNLDEGLAATISWYQEFFSTTAAPARAT